MTATRSNLTLVATALAAAMVASACGGSPGSGETKTTASEATTSKSAAAATTSKSASETTTLTPAAAAPADSDPQALLPTPDNAKQTEGPDTIADNGIHMYYRIEGSPTAVMDAYKAALEAKGWQVATIVSSGSEHGGGGATYTGTNGDAYGVFDGGGYENNTYLNVCTWSTKPANPNCTRGR